MDFSSYVEKRRPELIEATQEIIRIRSVEGAPAKKAPFGEGVASALNRTLEIAESLGFKTVNLDGYVGYAEYTFVEINSEKNRATEGEREYVAALGHLDVVPEGEGWSYPPYGAEIHDGKIYGRGAIDDKGPIMAALYGLKAIKDAGVKLGKPVRIIFGTNEENGSGEIAHYLEEEKPPVMGFTPDGDYPIIYAEKGVLVFKLVKEVSFMKGAGAHIKSINGGTRPNIVPDLCTVEIETADFNHYIRKINQIGDIEEYDVEGRKEKELLLLLSKGKAAHGSAPQLGKNAITQMLDVLNELGLCVDEVSAFTKKLFETVGKDVFGKTLGIGREDKVSGPLTLNIGTIETCREDDSPGGRGRITLMGDVRYPVTYDGEELLELLKKKFENAGIGMELLVHMRALYYEKEHPLIIALQKAYTEVTGNKAELLAIGGGTYGKAMPNIVAFGPVFPGQENLCHQPDEFIEVEDLIKNAKIYANALFQLAK